VDDDYIAHIQCLNDVIVVVIVSCRPAKLSAVEPEQGGQEPEGRATPDRWGPGGGRGGGGGDLGGRKSHNLGVDSAI
jgi:hypothetical protein